MRTRVKICCIQSVEEARVAVAYGADALGLVSAMPSGPGVVDEEAIARMVAFCPPPVATFLLTAHTEAEAIAAQHARCPTSAIQLCDTLAADELRRLSLQLRSTGVKLVVVVHVDGPAAIDRARAQAEHADALLLDSGRPDAATRELGGTGRAHDWDISARVVEAVGAVPVFLAGGLQAENVREAIARVGPYGVDLCSGVRTDQKLDATRLHAFMSQVAAADAERSQP